VLCEDTQPLPEVCDKSDVLVQLCWAVAQPVVQGKLRICSAVVCCEGLLARPEAERKHRFIWERSSPCNR